MEEQLDDSLEFPEGWDLYKRIEYLIDELVDTYASHEYESYYPSINKELMPKLQILIEQYANQARTQGRRIQAEATLDKWKSLQKPSHMTTFLVGQVEAHKFEALNSQKGDS